MIMMALLHMTGLENSECIWKNPAQSGSGCIHFNNIIISLEINLFSRSLWYRWKKRGDHTLNGWMKKYKYTGSNTSSVTNEWSLTVTDLNLVVSITRSYIAQFFLLNRLNRLWKIRVSEWLLFNANSANFHLYHSDRENKLISNEMMMLLKWIQPLPLCAGFFHI
jgi:hypothetical protein